MWQCVGASSRGVSHLRSDLPCQDAYAYRVVSDDCVLAAIADGLGSAAHSEEGAKSATQSALDSLQESLSKKSKFYFKDWKEILLGAFKTAIEKLQQKSKESGVALREYGTTLIIIVIYKNQVAIGHIGDGAVVALCKKGDVKTVSAPIRGEYANEVMPITSAGALNAIRIFVTKDINAVAALTDGLQNLCIQNNTNEPFIPFFTPFFDAIQKSMDVVASSQELHDFLDSERICAKTDDDKTLLIAGKINSKPKA
jgi:hypothetical protein